MTKSTTRIVQTTKVAERAYASVIVRLMMCVNDISLVNDTLRDWSESTDRRRESRKPGARMYFVRVQMAHLFEGLKIIREIRDTKALMDEVEKCGAATQRSFEQVATFLDSDDYKLLDRIRNNVAFHYDAKLAKRAVDEIAEQWKDDRSANTLGEEPIHWYFELADKCNDRIVVRYILGLPIDAEIAKESDLIAGRIFDISKALADFAGYFIWERGTL